MRILPGILNLNIRDDTLSVNSMNRTTNMPALHRIWWKTKQSIE